REAADLLTLIERFATAVSVRFLTYTVPYTAAQREEIADAIAQSYRDDINTHAEAIATYTHETRLGTISNRREAIQVTYEHMGRLRNLMNGRYESLRQQMADLLNKLRNLETEIETRAEQAAHEQQQAGGRRIVTSGVEPLQSRHPAPLALFKESNPCKPHSFAIGLAHCTKPIGADSMPCSI